jgi:hypothetical protein
LGMVRRWRNFLAFWDAIFLGGFRWPDLFPSCLRAAGERDNRPLDSGIWDGLGIRRLTSPACGL